MVADVHANGQTCSQRVAHILTGDKDALRLTPKELWECLQGVLGAVRPYLQKLSLPRLENERHTFLHPALPRGLEWATECVPCRFQGFPATESYAFVTKDGELFFHLHDDACHKRCRILRLREKTFHGLQGLQEEVVRAVLRELADFFTLEHLHLQWRTLPLAFGVPGLPPEEPNGTYRVREELAAFVSSLRHVSARFAQSSWDCNEWRRYADVAVCR